jgi:hypothetical protein
MGWFDMENFERIIKLENEIEAQLVGSILEERGIPHFIRTFHDTAYDGLIQMVEGWGEVLAPSEYKDTIISIVEDVRQNRDEN